MTDETAADTATDQGGQDTQNTDTESQVALGAEESTGAEQQGASDTVDQDKGQETALTSDDQEAGSDTSKDNESEEAQTGAPESYAEFNLPEGYEMSADYLSEIQNAFKAEGLSQEAAQRIIDSHVKGLQAAQAKSAEQTKDVVTQWLEESKADPKIGGDKWENSLADAKKALRQFGTPELNAVLRDFGIGNHVEIIRAFAKIGSQLGEDQPGSGEGTVDDAPKDRATRMYGENGGVNAT